MKTFLNKERAGIPTIGLMYGLMAIAVSLSVILVSNHQLVPLIWLFSSWYMFRNNLAAKFVAFQLVTFLWTVLLIKALIAHYFTGIMFFGYFMIALLMCLYVLVITLERYKL